MAYCECRKPDDDNGEKAKCRKCGCWVRGYSFYDEEMSIQHGRGAGPLNIADMHDPDDPTR